MSAALLAALLWASPLAPPAENPAHRYERCLAQIELNAQAALESALEWMNEGGGAPAGHCHALALIETGHADEAAARLEALAKARGGFGDGLRQEILIQAGNAWLIAGDPRAAAADLTAAIDLARLAKLGAAPEATALADRARARILSGDTKAARADLDGAIKLLPTAAALTTRARLERLAGERGSASADVERALKLDAKFAEAYLERGRLFALMRDAGAARKDFLTAAQLAGNGPVADEAQNELAALDIKG